MCLHKIDTNRLPPVCRAFDIISLHLSLIESEVTGARGKVLINVLGATSVASLLLLELLLELLWDQRKTTAWTSTYIKRAACRKKDLRYFFGFSLHNDTTNTFCARCPFMVFEHNLSYLSSFASGLPCDGDTTGVVCSFLLSSEGLSPPPGSS